MALLVSSRLPSLAAWLPVRTMATSLLTQSVNGVSAQPQSVGARGMASSSVSASAGETQSKQDTAAAQSRPKLVWEDYKRKHKGAVPPQTVRLRCKRNTKKKIVGNPCPICRNDAVVSHENIELLQQFISPYSGKLLESTITGVCRLQQKKLAAAIEKAMDEGLLPYSVPRHHAKTYSTEQVWNRINVED